MVDVLMARIRTVKPELWTDPEFVDCSTNARLLFVAALNFASDYGVLLDNPKQLKMLCFPGDSFDVADLVDELVAHNLWCRRVAPDGAAVLIIRTFAQHQRVDKRQDGRWGDPATWAEFPDHSGNVPGTVDEQDATGRPVMEGNGEDNSPAPSAPVADVPDEQFAQFWDAYPRKLVRKEALKAWRTAVKSTDPDVIIAGLEPWRSYWRKQRTAQEHIPHGATWLRQERWLETPSSGPPARDQQVSQNGELMAPGVQF